MYQLVQISCQMSSDQLLLVLNFIYKTSYLDEEVNCTKPSPSARVPWCIHRERTNVRSILALLSHIVLIKKLFGDHLKHSSRFWPFANGKSMSNDLVNAMLRQCMFALSSNTLAFSLHKHSRLFNFL
jgi:hypothetical protein